VSSAVIPDYWLPYSEKDGDVITISWAQVWAVQRAFSVWQSVVLKEKGEYPDMSNAANWQKSCLLARLLVNGKPPLPHPPPTFDAAPWYGLIEDGRADVAEPFVRGPVDWKMADGAMQTSFTIGGCLWKVLRVEGAWRYILEWPNYGEWRVRHRTADDPPAKKGTRRQADNSWADWMYDEADWVLESLQVAA
jgi:hypothetical protein